MWTSSATSDCSKRKIRVCVVGAGVAGLAVADGLLRSSSDEFEWAVTVLERKSEGNGGRVRTYMWPQNHLPKLEAGAWRVRKADTRVQYLFRRFGLPLVSAAHLGQGAPARGRGSARAGLFPGASVLDSLILADRHLDAGRALRNELATGYAGSLGAPAEPGRRPKGGFLVPSGGFGELVSRLEMSVQAAGAAVVRGTHVRDVSDGAVLVGDHWFHYDYVIVACPPRFTRRWPRFLKQTRLVHSCVEPVPLCHIYSDRRPESGVNKTSALGKTWPAAAPGLLGQASYSAGRLAEFWHRLSIGDPMKFQQLLGPRAECCYWAEGVHRFRPAFGFPGHLAVAKACFRPNPVDLPSVLLVGEAWSSHQGWPEGALETAEWALQWLLKTALAPARGKKQQVLVPPAPTTQHHHLEGGRYLDINLWETRHPGGEIPAGARSDLLSKMDAVGHSDAALACAFYLCL